MYTGDCIKCQPEVSACTQQGRHKHGRGVFYIIRTELNSTMRPGQHVTYQGCHERQGEFGCMHTLELSMGLHTHCGAAWTVVGTLASCT